MRNTQVVALLLLGVAVWAAAAAGRDLLEEPQQIGAQQVDASSKKHKHSGKDDDCYCEDGEDGKPGPPGPPGHPGKDGRNGRDGRDSLVIITYASVSKNKTFTYNSVTHQQHFIEVISATAQCAAGTKAIACSCGTSLDPAFKPLAPEYGVYGYHGEDWLERVNRITLVSNSLSQSKDAKFNDQCTCSGLAVATVKRDDKDYEEEYYRRYEEEEEDEIEEYKEREKEHKKKSEQEKEYKKKYDEDEYEEKPKAPKKYKKSVHIAAGYKGDYYGEWTKQMPALQDFKITATATCQEIKILPHYGKDYGYGYDGYDKDEGKDDDDDHKGHGHKDRDDKDDDDHKGHGHKDRDDKDDDDKDRDDKEDKYDEYKY